MKITDRFMSQEEIVADLLARLDDLDRNHLRTIPKSAMIQFHHTVGRNIRNYYLLWDEANPHTDASDPEGDKHPDQVSHAILEELWERVHV